MHTQVPSVPPLHSVAMSSMFGCAVGGNGRLYVWGSNEHGVLGLGASDAPTVVRQPTPAGGDVLVDAVRREW